MFKVNLDITSITATIQAFLEAKAESYEIKETRQGNFEIDATFELSTDVEIFYWLSEYHFDHSIGEFFDAFVEIA